MAIQILRPGQIGPIEPLGEDVYVSTARAPTGEVMYFAIESLEAYDRNKWAVYRNMATFFAVGGDGLCSIGSLAKIGSLVNNPKELNEFLAKKTKFWREDPVKFEQLCTHLRNRKISVKSPKAEELAEIQRALMGVNVREQTHMVYASKLPINKRMQFQPGKIRQFADYQEEYGHIILSVGVKIQDMVENRGISKNPLSIVEGGYGGIAMMAHSFTCIFVESIHPDITQFRVRPLKMMGKIFLKALPNECMTINGKPAEEHKDGFEVEHDVLVPVHVLASLHRASIEVALD